jgi:hypothetical protein
MAPIAVLIAKTLALQWNYRVIAATPAAPKSSPIARNLFFERRFFERRDYGFFGERLHDRVSGGVGMQAIIG